MIEIKCKVIGRYKELYLFCYDDFLFCYKDYFKKN